MDTVYIYVKSIYILECHDFEKEVDLTSESEGLYTTVPCFKGLYWIASKNVPKINSKKAVIYMIKEDKSSLKVYLHTT